MQRIPLAELPNFVRNVLATVATRSSKDTAARAYLIALEGDLGAGKTTFVQALARELGVHALVQSPTYVLMRSYPLRPAKPSPEVEGRFDKLVHIDAYRLESPQACAALRPEVFLNDPRALVVVEWPERLGACLPKPDVRIMFSSDGADPAERYIEVV